MSQSAWTSTDLAYLAGLLDGEGTLGVYGRTEKGRREYVVACVVANTSTTLMEWLVTKFGGSYKARKQTNKGSTYVTNDNGKMPPHGLPGGGSVRIQAGDSPGCGLPPDRPDASGGVRGGSEADSGLAASQDTRCAGSGRGQGSASTQAVDASTGASSPGASSSPSQASPSGGAAGVCSAGGAGSQTRPWWPITDGMIWHALSVLRASGRLAFEAEGVDQVLVREVLAAAREAYVEGV
jgi:hypothetical protein